MPTQNRLSDYGGLKKSPPISTLLQCALQLFPSRSGVHSPSSHLSWICDSFGPQAYGGSDVLSLRSLRLKRFSHTSILPEPYLPWEALAHLPEKERTCSIGPRPSETCLWPGILQIYDDSKSRSAKSFTQPSADYKCSREPSWDQGTSQMNCRLLFANKCLLF